VGTYLTRIAINLSLNELKKRKRVVSLFTQKQEESGWSDLSDEGRDADRRDAREVVEAALQELDEGFRAVVVLRLIEGYSTKETAEILNLPLGTVLSRLARAQKQLKEILMNKKI
jgi:RNA polymerase sigma-70 factor (ECF subfamily)